MTLPLNMDSRGAGGLPVLFAHSFAGDVSHWHATLEHLRRQRRVVAFDFSGHGRSPGAVGSYSIGELAKDVDAVADAQQLDAFVLVGHSMGAAVAADYAGSHPARVRALVLVDPPPAPGAITADQIRQLHAAVARDPFPVIEQFWNQQMFIDTRDEVKQKLLAGLREFGLQYDRDDSGGEFFHFSTPMIGSRVFFEIAQRVGGYSGVGAANAPVRMAAHRRLRTVGSG